MGQSGVTDVVLQRSVQAEPTYPELGATRAAALDGEPLPPGYHTVRLHRPVGHGAGALDAAAECVLGWQMHRGAGILVSASNPRAVVGATMVQRIGLGPARISAPCRVLWTVDEPGRRGFGYGTLPGHPETGEEAFLISRDDADDVWLTILAFSRAGCWYTRVAGPLARVAQRLAARAYQASVVRAVSRAPST